MRLLQVCNVGRIVGGTAACAWTITRALPDCEHHVAFLSPPTAETKRVFEAASIHAWQRVDDAFVQSIDPEFVILHNTPVSRCDGITSAVSLQYIHSRGRRASAGHTMYCSRWLAAECGALDESQESADGRVLYQAVPRPAADDFDERRELSESLIVGRICTPTAAKWHESLLDFHARLASRHSDVEWEFVGCPTAMIPRLAEACHGRVRFHEASWKARRHLFRWHAMLYHHPTLTESFGRTVAEALRSGCVPIVDNRGGFCEQVTAGTGHLCTTRNDFELALEVIRDRRRWREMSRHAKIHGDRMFSIAAFRERLLRALRRLTDS
jgi:hypothetical protein